MIPVVIFQAPHEQRQVSKLVKYCKALDGTEIRVITAPEPHGMRYPEIANWSYKQVCREMAGTPFIWIEADSVPLKAGWAKALEDEYTATGKPFLLPLQYNPPHDLSTAIGVHPANAHDLVPDGISRDGFDGWIYKHLPDKIAGTDLIRHSYGFYNEKGDAALHQFPRDMDIIGDKAVIFHKDKNLSLINVLDPSFAEEPVINVSGVGDLGDAILSLATLKHHGGKFDYYLRDNGATKGIVARAHIIRPLLESQPYINAVCVWRREEIEWASEGFRPSFHDSAGTLAGSHAHHALSVGFIKSMPDLSKSWLTVDGDSKWNGSVVINRTSRYNNPYFPWRQIVQHYGNRIVFLGSGDEYGAFCRAFGHVRYYITHDMLEAAKVIAGSSLFIGNQSACMTIAEGIKHPRILEAGLRVCDCIYPGSTNASHVIDGAVTLPDVGGSGTLEIPSQALTWRSYLQNYVPDCGKGRWGWHYKFNDVMLNEGLIEFIVKKLKKLSGWDEEKCQREIVQFTVAMNPNWFAKRVKTPQFDLPKRALKNAGIEGHPLLK